MKIINFYNNLDSRLGGKLTITIFAIIIPVIVMIWTVFFDDLSVNNKNGEHISIFLDMLMGLVFGYLLEMVVAILAGVLWLAHHAIKYVVNNYTSMFGSIVNKTKFFFSSVKGAAEEELTTSKIIFK